MNPIIEVNSGQNLGNPNPHLKYTDFVQHGYFILDIKPDSTQADYFFTPIREVTNEVQAGESWYTQNGASSTGGDWYR